MRSIHTVILILALCAAGSGLMYAKMEQLGLPLLPGKLEPVWSVEASIEFDPVKRGAIVDFDVPDDLGDFDLLNEYFVGRDYGLNVETVNNDRRAEWSTRQARGLQRLYYRAEMVAQLSEPADTSSAATPLPPQVPAYEEPLASAITDILSEVREESANVFTFASQLITRLGESATDENVRIVRGNLDRDSEAWVSRVIYVLAGARIAARLVRGVVLEDGVSQQQARPWLEIHNGQRWMGFDPRTGSKGYPDNFVRWSVGDAPLIKTEGTGKTQVSFAVSRYSQSLTAVALERADANHSWLSALLLFDLPVATQNVYRTLLMVPLGALIVAFMRTVVGIPTLGTFMPILIAIAFRETELLWGVALFILVTAAGLFMRFYLERLQLLLVPRLCCVLVLVVLSMLAISLVSAHLGLDRGFSIALFPIVILTMVIEHMSVVWEQSGAGAAFKEGFGSLVVAVLGYLLMSNDILTHVVFLFPEILLVVLAMFIAMGRYTGYRISEIVRFRDVVSETDNVRAGQ